MERAIHALLLILCGVLIVVVALAILGPDDESPKGALLERIGSQLREEEVPLRVSECLLRDLDRRLDSAEISAAGRPPPRALRESGLACARRLVAAGAYTPREMLVIGRRLQPLGF